MKGRPGPNGRTSNIQWAERERGQQFHGVGSVADPEEQRAGVTVDAGVKEQAEEGQVQEQTEGHPKVGRDDELAAVFSDGGPGGPERGNGEEEQAVKTEKEGKRGPNDAE